jgi:hypothetical protein
MTYTTPSLVVRGAAAAETRAVINKPTVEVTGLEQNKRPSQGTGAVGFHL